MSEMPPSPTGAQGPVGKPRSIALVLLLTIVTLDIWAIVWSYQNGEEIKQHTRTGLGGVVYILVTLFISPVTMFLLPLIGNLIWYVRIQSSINDYRTSHGSDVKPGL